MADQKLSDLAALPTPITTGDLLYVARAGNQYKAASTDLPSSPTAVTAATVLADTALIVGSGGVRGAASSTLSGIPLLTSGVPTESNVTNDAQTKAAIVPNTAPAAGALLVGNAGGTAYASVSMSGDATLASTGAMTLTPKRQTFSNADASVTAGYNVIAQVGTMSADRTLTLAAANTYQPGATVLITDSSATVAPNKRLIISRAGSDTINGVATSIYLGGAGCSIRLETDGSSKWTVTSGTVDTMVITAAMSPYTWNKSGGLKAIRVTAWGAGGGGGGGSGGTANPNAVNGGSGGGGGAYNAGSFEAAALAATETATVGAGGSVGTGGSGGANGTAGGAGGNTSFGSRLFAYGGGGGGPGTFLASSGIRSGGGGGGVGGAGVTGSGTSTAAGGAPAVQSSTTPAMAVGGSGGSGYASTTGGIGEFGGGGGGATNGSGSANAAGLGSLWGGGGGGAGGGYNTSGSSFVTGGTGGKSGSMTQGGGIAGGGTNGTDAGTTYPSGWGGGGGTGSTSAPVAGGNGGLPAGGAGGGGGCNHASTAGASGGTGGAGQIVITQFF